jgi:hypothetical protein
LFGGEVLIDRLDHDARVFTAPQLEHVFEQNRS